MELKYSIVSKLKKTIAKFRKEYDTITNRINKFN